MPEHCQNRFMRPLGWVGPSSPSGSRTPEEQLPASGRPAGNKSAAARPGTSSSDLAHPTHPLKMAEAHDCLTLFFSDICGFSEWAHKLSPEKVMNALNDLYIRLDNVIIHEMPMLYKVETIGDAYMVAGNLTEPDPAHAATMVRFALRAQQEAAKVPRPDLEDGTMLQMRIGLHSGPAMSGIVGKLRRRFCIFGDTVNMTSRTETACPPGSIQVTAATHSLAAPHLGRREVLFQDRGPVQLKGAQQPVHMYLAQGPGAPAAPSASHHVYRSACAELDMVLGHTKHGRPVGELECVPGPAAPAGAG